MRSLNKKEEKSYIRQTAFKTDVKPVILLNLQWEKITWLRAYNLKLAEAVNDLSELHQLENLPAEQNEKTLGVNISGKWEVIDGF